MQSWLHDEPPPCTKQPIEGRGIGGASIILVGALGYSWGIRGVFVGYSWDIRMYRVCVGNVSGMYRECIERYEEGKMRKNDIFSEKNLVVSGKFSTFAGESVKQGDC